MKSREELLAQIETWEGLNKYLAREAKQALSELDEAGSKEVELVEPELVIEVSEEPKEEEKLSKEELKDLTKKEQSAMLKELGVDKIPRFESDRVDLLFGLLN